MSTPRSRSTITDIDVFRGVAALLVAAMHAREVTWIGIRQFWALHGTHITPGSLLGYATFPLVWGSIGVPVFFVLSGYCIHRSQATARARAGTYQLDAGNFLLRRFCRIYPVVAGALVLTFLCDWASQSLPPASAKLGDTSLHLFLVNLFSLQGVAGAAYGSNAPLWTLSIEVQFYALYPLLLLLMARMGQVPTLLGLTILNVVSYFTGHLHGVLIFSSFYVSWYLGALVAEIEVAGGLARWLSVGSRRAFTLAAGGLVIAAGCAVFFLNNFLAFQVWALGFSAILFATLTRPTPMRGWLARWFAWMGTFSFSLYIIHLPVVVLIHSLTFRSAPQAGLGPYLASLIAVVAAAYLFSLVFERPALALSQRLKASPAAGPTDAGSTAVLSS